MNTNSLFLNLSLLATLIILSGCTLAPVEDVMIHKDNGLEYKYCKDDEDCDTDNDEWCYKRDGDDYFNHLCMQHDCLDINHACSEDQICKINSYSLYECQDKTCDDVYCVPNAKCNEETLNCDPISCKDDSSICPNGYHCDDDSGTCTIDCKSNDECNPYREICTNNKCVLIHCNNDNSICKEGQTCIENECFEPLDDNRIVPVYCQSNPLQDFIKNYNDTLKSDTFCVPADTDPETNAPCIQDNICSNIDIIHNKYFEKQKAYCNHLSSAECAYGSVRTFDRCVLDYMHKNSFPEDQIHRYRTHSSLSFKCHTCSEQSELCVDNQICHNNECVIQKTNNAFIPIFCSEQSIHQFLENNVQNIFSLIYDISTGKNNICANYNVVSQTLDDRRAICNELESCAINTSDTHFNESFFSCLYLDDYKPLFHNEIDDESISELISFIKSNTCK